MLLRPICEVTRALVLRSALVAAIAATGLTLTCAPAGAHTDLVSSNPGRGQVLAVPPDAVTLVFTESMEARLSDATLTVDGDLRGPLEIEDGRGTGELVAAVSPSLLTEAAAAETVQSWRVDYRVTSVDGHPVSGQVTFVVEPSDEPDGGGLGDPVPAPTEVDGSPATEVGEAAATDGENGPTWGLYVVLAGVALLGGLSVAAARRLRRSAAGES